MTRQVVHKKGEKKNLPICLQLVQQVLQFYIIFTSFQTTIFSF